LGVLKGVERRQLQLAPHVFRISRISSHTERVWGEFSTTAARKEELKTEDFQFNFLIAPCQVHVYTDLRAPTNEHDVRRDDLFPIYMPE
jgi:hypothetical protein